MRPLYRVMGQKVAPKTIRVKSNPVHDCPVPWFGPPADQRFFLRRPRLYLIGDALVARLNVAMRLTQMAALSKNEGSHYREANTRPLCCIIFLFNRSDRRFVHRSCPIGSRLGLFRGQDGKWRKSQRERHDRRSSNSSIWNAGAHNPPAQWSLCGRADQRPRTICARPGHRRDASSSPRVRLLGSSVRDA